MLPRVSNGIRILVLIASSLFASSFGAPRASGLGHQGAWTDTTRTLPSTSVLDPRGGTRRDASNAQLPRTTVVVLGSGTPIPDPERAGPSTAIIVDSVAYLIDAGAGVVRRAAAAARGIDGLPALDARRLRRVFLTHLHSDHTMGLNDVIFTPWVMGRTEPLEVYGPPGTQRLVASILDGNSEDIAERLATPGGPSSAGWKVVVKDVFEGEVYRDSLIRVRAYNVPHSAWKFAYAYRIDTPDRSIVVSGDVRPTDVVARACNGCDILVHEVYSDSGLRTIPAGRRPYHQQAHTSARELGDIAKAAHPAMLVLTHVLLWSVDEGQLTREMSAAYGGRFVIARDLQRF